jgi:hypothetical protein
MSLTGMKYEFLTCFRLERMLFGKTKANTLCIDAKLDIFQNFKKIMYSIKTSNGDI